jgi:hypothetical protein
LVGRVQGSSPCRPTKTNVVFEFLKTDHKIRRKPSASFFV